ncbi:hypothetical protein LPY66_19480 [Dehalobacter sp. DCM]|uniref:hypothetical protein n=1 Tax=Dehalobacter sp. DCM TaxID=2907827 RepID=UPI0030813E79|nr:hypothetical protein LPY66_19480 [Dehalobacter sp. DCM]
MNQRNEATANIILLTPAILGTAAAWVTSFGFYGRSLSFGYRKFIFFTDIYTILASLGAGAYIFQLLELDESKDAKLKDIILPLVSVILLFALTYNMIYSLYPDTFSGTIGKTPVTQFMSFLSLSIGSISVGETFNVTPEKPGTQILAALESFWNLFVLSLLISLIV